MSTLYVDDVAGQGGGTETNLMDGLVKARVQYDQNTPSANDAVNVASVTDNAIGEFTVNMTNDFASTAYTPAGVAGADSAETAPRFISISADVGAVAAGNFSCQVGRDGAANEDSTNNAAWAWGDLA